MGDEVSHMRGRAWAPLLLTAAAGCELAGACLYEYRDPVVSIVLTGNPRPSEVAISDLVIQGSTVTGLAALVVTPSYGVRAATDTIYCTSPCGFSTTEGAYSFKASAPGYQSRTMTFEARYEDSDGGCPGFSSGSTEVRISLLPGS